MHPDLPGSRGTWSPAFKVRRSRLSASAIAGMAARNLFRHRRRSLINIVGVSVTVASVMFFQAFYRGSYEEMMFAAIIDCECAHIQVQTAGFTREDPDSYVRPPALIDGWQGIRQAASSVPGVSAVAPRLAAAAFAGNGARKRAIVLAGIDGEAERAVFRTLERLRAGRQLEGPGEILVGASLAALFGLGLGDPLRVQVRTVDDVPNIQEFTIVGLFSTGYSQIDRGMAFARLPDVQDLTSAGDRVNRLFVRVSSVDSVEKVRSAALGVLGRASGAPAGLSVTTWTEEAAGIVEHTRSDSMFMRIFLGILLVLAVSTVAATMYMVVFERTREIGTLRASGWQRSEVFRLFVTEAGLIGCAGAAAGLLVGVAAAAYLAVHPIELGAASESLEVPFLRITCRVAGADAALSFCAGVLAAVAAGIAPARRAAAMKIVRALAGR